MFAKIAQMFNTVGNTHTHTHRERPTPLKHHLVSPAALGQYTADKTSSQFHETLRNCVSPLAQRFSIIL